MEKKESKSSSRNSTHIERIIEFIIKEALEKSDEIKVLAENDYLIKKHTLLTEGKKKLLENHKQALKNKAHAKKVEAALSVKSKVLAIAKLQNSISTEIGDFVLQKFSAEKQTLLLELVTEAFIYLGHKKAKVICSEKDRIYVESNLSIVIEKLKNLLSCEIPVYSIVVDKNSCLESGFKRICTSRGGCILSNLEETVYVDNTIDNRVQKALKSCESRINSVLES